MSFRSSTLLLGTAAVALLLAGSASAQDRTGRYERADYQGPSETVIITAPRHHLERSDIGAPIEDVALSREVRFDDLDLTTRDGAHALHVRVRETARALCRQLSVRYPIATSDSPPCYEAAVSDAMAQADAAIDQARRE